MIAFLTSGFASRSLATGQYGERRPIMPVADGTGEIVEIGEDVTQFQAGDRVSGAYFPGWINGDVAPERRFDMPS